MRNGQRFTPARLRRWLDKGRGTGTGAEYEPWHQVTRDDPSSRGRSHILNWRFGRLHHLLSDQELVAFGFASMLPGLVDLREQFPLALESDSHELTAYQTLHDARALPGTLRVAEELGLKHPVVRREQDRQDWVMSTDLLVTMVNMVGGKELLAVSVKDSSDSLGDRKRQLLQIEREYWRKREVYWLLLTPSLYCPVVANNVRIGMPWTVGQAIVTSELISVVPGISHDLNGRTFADCIRRLSQVMGTDQQMALCVMWQSIWSGALPIDLSRSLRPDTSIQLLSSEAFWRQNPIVSRRTAWMN